MSAKFKHIARLPIWLVLFYVAATFFAFVYGPYDWPVENWTTLFVFLAVTMLAVWLGFRWAVAKTATGTSFGRWRLVIVLGTVASVIVLFVATPVYTGRM